MYSYDNTLGRLYTWEWAVHYVEPRFLANWDQTYKDWSNERHIKGIRIYADTLVVNTSIQLEIDNIPYFIFTANHNGREVKHYEVPIDGATTEYPRGRSVRLYPVSSNPGFCYSVEYFADEEPGRLANCNTRWQDGGDISAKYLQGFVLDADTQGTNKTVILEYYPEGAGSSIVGGGVRHLAVHNRSGGHARDHMVVRHTGQQFGHIGKSSFHL